MIILLPIAKIVLDWDMKQKEKRRRKTISNFIDSLLNNKKIIKLSNLGMLYLNNIPEDDEDKGYTDKSLFNDRSRQNFYYEVCRIAEAHLNESLKVNTNNRVISVCALDEKYYMLQQTLDELRLRGQQLSNERVIFVKQLGDWGIQNEELAYVCQNGIDDFPFTCYTSFIENLELPNGDIIKIPYEMMNKKVAAEEFTCSKCHGIFQKIFDHGGEKFCSNCIEEVKGAEREGKSVVFEVNPNEISMTEDMADIFVELDKK